MALSQAQRYQLNLLGVPDGSLADADLYALSGVIQTESSAPVSLTVAQRYQLNLLGVPDSSITVGDRFALAGVVETAISSGPNIQRFNVEWNIGPGWARVLTSAAGVFDVELAPFTFLAQGGTNLITNPLVLTWGARVTMDNNPLTFPTRISDHFGGSGKIVDFKAARTWIVDKLFARTMVSIQQPPVLCGCVQFKDTVCFGTTITDYVAASVRTPGIDPSGGRGSSGSTPAIIPTSADEPPGSGVG